MAIARTPVDGSDLTIGEAGVAFALVWAEAEPSIFDEGCAASTEA